MDTKDKEIYSMLEHCVSQALDMLDEKIHELSFFCTVEETYKNTSIKDNLAA